MQSGWNDKVRNHFIDFMFKGISQCGKIGKLLLTYSENSGFDLNEVKKQWVRVRKESPHIIEIARLNGKKYKEERLEYEKRIKDLKRQQKMSKPLSKSSCGTPPRQVANLSRRGRRVIVDQHGIVQLY